ncbi:hypothetical protein EPR50_G00113650 [Perca flavescens]|uniref:Uncharacterized protein n=1 Tax=Perca flavescens TaxID=8167 RepID=A0A484CUS1_PERFV|nr:hypothetical protein EPR50_G00113650 [Perca flavescens]
MEVDKSKEASSPQQEGEQAEVNQPETDMETNQEILNVLLGPNYSERSEEPDYKAKPSSSSSSFWTKATVKVFLVVTGQTFGADQVLLEQVKRSTAVETTRNLQECDVIIVFCPITSRVGSDVEAAMREDSGNRRTLFRTNVQVILQLRFCLKLSSV